MQNKFIKTIIKAMQEQNKSSRDIAKITGVSHTMIHYFVTGSKDITTAKLLKICEALDIKIDLRIKVV
jgi:DNA-binding Xre family transcriptional regulator